MILKRVQSFKYFNIVNHSHTTKELQ